MEALTVKVKNCVEGDTDVKNYIAHATQYKFSYIDDFNETMKISTDEELMAAYDDGL